MQFGIVEIAAWIIAWKAVFRIIERNRNDRNQRIEKGSVIAEWDELSRAEYRVKTDKTLSESDRDIKLGWQRERQRVLELRYPQYLVPSPGVEYFSQAIKKDKDRPDKLTWKEARMFLYGLLVFITLFLLGKFVLASLIQWLKELQV
jgi:hypothetical protein